MNKLYQKSRIWFAVLWIVMYVAASSIADACSEAIGVPKLFTLAVQATMCAAAVVFLCKQGAWSEYGFCLPTKPLWRYLWFVPLAAVSVTNLCFGISVTKPWHEIALTVASMVCVGFLEELIFRGFLYKAMRTNNIVSAMAVSSLTFGIGHMVNLFNGSGMALVANLCQVMGAVAFGFLFVVLFERGKSLWPCIVSHCVINSLSVFVDEQAITDEQRLWHSAVLAVSVLAYTLVLLKTLPKRE